MKRGVLGFEDMLQDYLVYFILLVLFVGGLIAFTLAKQDAAGHWEQVYANVLVHALARAELGDVIRLDFRFPAELAVRSGVPFSSLVSLHPEQHKVCTHFGKGTTCAVYVTSHKVVLLAPVSEQPGPKELVLGVVE
jgi:hypothetical protein